MISLERVLTLDVKYENLHASFYSKLEELKFAAENAGGFHPALFDDFDEVFSEFDHYVTRLLHSLTSKAREATRENPAKTLVTLKSAENRVNHTERLYEEARELLNFFYKSLPKRERFPSTLVSENRRTIREITAVTKRIFDAYLDMARESERQHRLSAH